MDYGTYRAAVDWIALSLTNSSAANIHEIADYQTTRMVATLSHIQRTKVASDVVERWKEFFTPKDVSDAPNT